MVRGRGVVGLWWRGIRQGTVAAGLALLVAACSTQGGQFAFQDRDAGLTRSDFRDGLAARAKAPAAPEAPIPALVPLSLPVRTTVPAAVRLLTVRSDEEMPVRDLLVGMARTAGVDVDIDSGVEGNVVLSATNRPFLEIVERVAERANLRWEFRDGYLRVEPDSPVLRSYRIDYLNVVRQTESSVTTSAAVAGVGNAGGSNGSASSVTGKVEADFWKELQANLSAMLGLDPLTGAPPAAAQAAAAPAAAAIPAQAAGPTVSPQLAAALDAATRNPTAAGGLAGMASALAAATAPAPVPPPDAAPIAVAAPAAPPPPAAQLSINRQAGLVTVRATDRQHRQVAAYLRDLRRTATAQVLIEARVLEVALTDEFEAGVNWRSVFGGVFEGGTSFGQVVAEPPFTGSDGLNPATAGRATLALSNGDITAVANLVQRFGTVRTLSSPRVTVVQNQTAVLKVAQNQVYFRLDFETTDSQNGSPSRTTVASEISTVPVGVIITVQPSINTDTDRVALAVRPTVTRIIDFVPDPAVAIASNNRVESLIPVVAVQELDSVVTMASGQVLVMGGLMQDSTMGTDTGLPVVSGVPLLGYLFKSREDATAKRELVIFLKATIVGGSALDGYDTDIYQSFGGDRRPL